MPDFSQVLKAEIIRLSRKEVKLAVAPLHDSTIKLKKTIVDLKQKVAQLEAAQKQASTTASRNRPTTVPQEGLTKLRVSSKNIKQLRAKLGLPRELFAKLLGVSSQAVYAMEHKGGRLKLRGNTLASYRVVRDMGKREAKRRIEKIG